ncbi:hypothetical protein M408DRAFT_326842 [Serendipita vermifera MAFF 305830]|uniref:Thioredoxin domain-containing protein n=1 Tax=Serendipita vermifera MAFF 305830 TaxID=933852 RepID=A0A0C3B5U0_SERVB|nr:hypothetical protein M408DRAFT_326842 [Serendipita vermifera MAFF 305830]
MAELKKISPSDKFDQSTLEKAAKISVWSENGESVTFGSLFEKQKTIVVFIRHFLCGVCHAYVEELGRVPKSALDEAGTRIVVIGCGEWSVIKAYKETTQFPYEIYAEPTRAIYNTFGFTSNMSGVSDQPPRKYPPGIFWIMVKFFWDILTKYSMFTKSGNISQLGGDFIIGPGLDIKYGRRMRNARDHVDVPELMHEAGVVYAENE